MRFVENANMTIRAASKITCAAVKLPIDLLPIGTRSCRVGKDLWFRYGSRASPSAARCSAPPLRPRFEPITQSTHRAQVRFSAGRELRGRPPPAPAAHARVAAATPGAQQPVGRFLSVLPCALIPVALGPDAVLSDLRALRRCARASPLPIDHFPRVT